MKTKNLFLCLIVLLTVYASCEKDSMNKDPEGTIPGTISLYSTIKYKGFEIHWSRPDNIYVGYDQEIVCVSLKRIDGLNQIKSVPDDGWNSEMACYGGRGYIVRRKITPFGVVPPVYEYLRLMITSSIVNTDKGIFGANVKYQAPFMPKNK